MVRSRLRAARALDPYVRLSVRRGVVRLAGRLEALWKRRFVKARVEQMPGVLAVDAAALEVERSARPDTAIATSVRALLRGAISIEESTLAVSVHDGHVVLQGTVLSRDEWEHALDLVSRVEGVHSITNLTVEAPRKKRRDGSLARRLRRTLHQRLPRARDVDVAVVGQAAVLRGMVPTGPTKRAAAQLLGASEAIQRVVNKVQVSPQVG